MKKVTIDINFVKNMLFWAEIQVALPEDGVQHTETCGKNLANISLCKYIFAFSWYIWRGT